MHAIQHRAAALLLPCQCVSCRQFSETTGLCADCWSGLSPVTSPFCQHCGLPLAEQLDDGICAGCWAAPPAMTRIRTALRYDDSSRELILKLKHGDALQLVPFISRLMDGRFAELTTDTRFLCLFHCIAGAIGGAVSTSLPNWHAISASVMGVASTMPACWFAGAPRKVRGGCHAAHANAIWPGPSQHRPRRRNGWPTDPFC